MLLFFKIYRIYLHIIKNIFMKKLIFSLFIALTLSSFSPIEKTIEKKAKAKVETKVACNYGQCQATAKSTGNQCKHCVSKSGDSYCWQHK